MQTRSSAFFGARSPAAKVCHWVHATASEACVLARRWRRHAVVAGGVCLPGQDADPETLSSRAHVDHCTTTCTTTRPRSCLPQAGNPCMRSRLRVRRCSPGPRGGWRSSLALHRAGDQGAVWFWRTQARGGRCRPRRAHVPHLHRLRVHLRRRWGVQGAAGQLQVPSVQLAQEPASSRGRKGPQQGRGAACGRAGGRGGPLVHNTGATPMHRHAGCAACRFKVYKGTDVKGKPNNSTATMQKRKAAKAW